MITVTQKPANAQGNISLKAEYAPLRCTLDATFYPKEKQVGIWIGGGDDWKEEFEPCSTVHEAIKTLSKSMKEFIAIADGNL